MIVCMQQNMTKLVSDYSLLLPFVQAVAYEYEFTAEYAFPEAVYVIWHINVAYIDV